MGEAIGQAIVVDIRAKTEFSSRDLATV
jgi:hypothetical protein